MVTDDGFKVPWFKLVLSFGWDYVGRIRGRTMLRENGENDWDHIKNLYPMATTTPKYLGCLEMTRSNPLNCPRCFIKEKPRDGTGSIVQARAPIAK